MRTPRIIIVSILALHFMCSIFVYGDWNQNASTGPFDYNTTGNWESSTINDEFDLVPTDGLNVTFASNTTLSNPMSIDYTGTNDITFRSDSGTSRQITFGGDFSASTGTSGKNITFGTGGNPLTFVFPSTTTFDLDATTMVFAGEVDYSSDLTIASSNNGAITFSGNFDNTSASDLTLAFNANNWAADITVSGVISDGSGGGSVELSRSGTSGAGALRLSAVNTFTGRIGVYRGSVYFNSITNVAAGNSALGNPQNATDGSINMGLTWGGGLLRYNGTGGHTTDRAMLLTSTTGTSGLYSEGSGAITWSGNITANNTTSKIFNFGGTDTNDNTYSGVIADVDAGNASNVLSLDKVDAGKWILSGDNTHEGSTTVSDGELEIQHVDALGDKGSATTSSVTSGATLSLNISGTNTIDNEDITINGTGDSSNGAMYVKDGALTWSGAVTMGSNSTIQVNSGDSLDIYCRTLGFVIYNI